MKIQRTSDHGFHITTKNGEFCFNPTDAHESDFAVYNEPQTKTKNSSGKNLSLPGEFEISGVLISSFYTDERKNLVFKTFVEDLSIVNFGNLKIVPKSSFFEQLGENVDLIIVNLSEDFDAKSARDLVDKIDPRAVILAGDSAQFPKAVETMSAKFVDNPLKLKRSDLSEDKTEVYIINE